MAERGHSLESIKASIDARKPDFDAYIDPQKAHADVIIQVLPTQLIPDDNEGKILRVRLIQKARTIAGGGGDGGRWRHPPPSAMRSPAPFPLCAAI